MTPNITDTLLLSLNQGILSAIMFLPNLIAGTIILLIGIIVGSTVSKLLVSVLKSLNVEKYFKWFGIPEAKDRPWTPILAEIVRWFIIILFLIPTAEIWRLPQFATILNQFLLYLPNVFVAAIIGLVGLIFARIAGDLVLAASKGFSTHTANVIASGTRVAVTIFVLLAVLNQLGIAQDLIKILFTGFVAMIALAGGLAFGLGGKDTAEDILTHLRKKLK
jgi:hypothetical protein